MFTMAGQFIPSPKEGKPHSSWVTPESKQRNTGVLNASSSRKLF